MDTNDSSIPSECGSIMVITDFFKHPISFGMRRMFYLVLPSETSHQDVKDIPNYVDQAYPFFLTMIILEMVILRFTDKPNIRCNDLMSSLTAWLISQMPMLLVRNIELSSYIWVFDRYHIVELPWNNSLTWLATFLGVDFCYYWVHRMAHEVNFMWAGHQVHHSSEDINFSIALRQSAFQRYSSWIFYLPMALFIPPSIFLVHTHFSFLYQFWIHTEVVKSLGPLEYVLNTASHHRVHHGQNRRYIDKNYGGTLIIWDRLFGTFESEKDAPVYGTVHLVNSWDAIYIQLCHWKCLLMCMRERKGIMDKVKTVIYGPSWEPGKPRLGCTGEWPDINSTNSQERYDKNVPIFWIAYTYTHLALVFVGHTLLGQLTDALSPSVLYLFVLFLLWTLTDIGFIFEHKWYAVHLELLRCAVFLGVDVFICGDGACHHAFYIPRSIFIFSASAWLTSFLISIIYPDLPHDKERKKLM